MRLRLLLFLCTPWLASGGCSRVEGVDGTDGVRLALYSMPASLPTDATLLLTVGARLIGAGSAPAQNPVGSGMDAEPAPPLLWCLRLSATRGNLVDPSALLAADGGASPISGCTGPHCVQTPFVSQGSIRVAYAVYQVTGTYPNDMLFGAVFTARSCADAIDGEPVTQSTLLLYPPSAGGAGGADGGGTTDTEPDASDAIADDGGGGGGDAGSDASDGPPSTDADGGTDQIADGSVDGGQS